jgi:hypothetical protein
MIDPHSDESPAKLVQFNKKRVLYVEIPVCLHKKVAAL